MADLAWTLGPTGGILSCVAGYIVTLIQSGPIRIDTIRADSPGEAARAIHEDRGDAVGACYDVRDRLAQ